MQEVRSGAVTHGHRFLATSGRPGRAIKVQDLRRLPGQARRATSSCSIATERRERIVARARAAGAAARRARAPRGRRRVGPARRGARPRRVPDGRRRALRARVPRAAGGSADDHDDPSPALVSGVGRGRHAAIGVSCGDEHAVRRSRSSISRNAERVLAARLRDARFFWNADRAAALDTRIHAARHDPVPQEAGQLSRQGRPPGTAGALDGRSGARARGRCRPRRRSRDDSRRPTSPPTWCASSRSCKARWAASMRAQRVCPNRCGRPSTSTTCRSAVEADAPPSRDAARHGRWRVGGGVAGRQARYAGRLVRGGRDARPARATRTALRRQAHGVFRLLVDLPGADGPRRAPRLASSSRPPRPGTADVTLDEAARAALLAFLGERLRYLLEQRGYDTRERSRGDAGAADRAAESARGAADARGAAGVHGHPAVHAARDGVQAREEHRARAGRRGVRPPRARGAGAGQPLREPAELALAEELERRRPAIDHAPLAATATTAARWPKRRASGRRSTASSPTCS